MDTTTRTSASTTDVKPKWLSFRNINDLTESQIRYAQARASYTFQIANSSKQGAFPTVSPQCIQGLWNFCVNSVPICFAVIDKRRLLTNIRADEAIIGCSLCADAADKEGDEVWLGLETFQHLFTAAAQPVRQDLLKQYGGDQPQKGLVLVNRVMYIDPNCVEKEAAASFLAAEKELITRARAAGYKAIITAKIPPIIQAMARDLGYKERLAIQLSKFVDDPHLGSRPFSHLPDSVEIRTMAIDL